MRSNGLCADGRGKRPVSVPTDPRATDAWPASGLLLLEPHLASGLATTLHLPKPSGLVAPRVVRYGPKHSMLSSQMRHHVAQSVSAVTTSVGRFEPGLEAARAGPRALEARSDGGLAAATRALSLSSATRCSAARRCSAESSYFCESMQTATFLYFPGTTSAIWVRPRSSIHRQREVACAPAE